MLAWNLEIWMGMEFRNLDEAWAFWLSYGGQKRLALA
jgi:hypothetical protein